MLTGNNGILQRAGEAKENAEESQIIEEIKMDILSYQTSKSNDIITDKKLEKILSPKFGNLSTDEKKTINKKLTTKDGKYVIPVSKIYNGTIKEEMGISESDSGIGFYIKKDNKYAIVFADRVTQAGQTVEWSTTNNSTCTFPTLTDEQKNEDFKKYTITNETYNDSNFGEKRIIEVVDSSGEDRFMALALNTFENNGNIFEWYAAVRVTGGVFGNMNDYNNADTGTSTEFLSGKTNTNRMIAKWNLGENGGYGAHDLCIHETKHYDIWGQIQNEVLKGWFIPSKDEWSAFGYALFNKQLTKNARTGSAVGLSGNRWSSTQSGPNAVWSVFFGSSCMHRAIADNHMSVRLAITY